MFNILDLTKDDLIAVQVSGNITKEDYERINPLIDKTVKEYGKMKLFIQLDQIKAMSPDALITDIKTYMSNFNNIKKVAIVGDNKWQTIIAGLTGPFISGKIKHFSKSRIAEAQTWIQE